MRKPIRSGLMLNSLILCAILLALLISPGICADQSLASVNQVEIKDYSFQPSAITVPVGTTVTWINDGSVQHTVTSDDGKFNSGNILSGGQFKFVFSQPGTFRYHCNIHPSIMTGMVTVTSAQPAMTPSVSTTPNTTQPIMEQPSTTSMPAVMTTPPNSGYSTASPSATQNAAQYTQFYTMNTGPAPNAHISAPQQYNISGSMPTTVYFSNQMQPVPFSQYQSTPTYSGNDSLWIKGATDWSQYAAVPVGANVSLLAISPTGGSGLLNLVDANGQTYRYNYFFYPNSRLTFYADIPGRHIMSFVVGGISSNPVVIDVTGALTITYAPTNNYYPATSSYPGYYSPYSYIGPQSALDLADANKADQKLYSDNWNYGIYPMLNAP